MNRYVFVPLLLLLSSCSFFSKTKLKSTTVITSISTNIPSAQGLDLKLKTELYGDSAVIQVFPVLGLNLATILVTNDNIYVKNKLNNEETVLSVLDFDPDLNFKKLLKLAIKKKQFNDTTYYKTPNVNYTFTDYVNITIVNSNNKSVFVPRYVSIDANNKFFSQKNLNLNIDYKLVKLNK